MLQTPSPGTVNVLPSTETVAPVGGVPKLTVVSSIVPSTSVSSNNTSTVTAMSSWPVTASSAVIGASFTGVTVTDIVPIGEVLPSPSLTV